MEYHDLLHGHIRFDARDETSLLLGELINSPEINRLRNMRQMNFDVPLIQELGRSRRLPHSIGVSHIALLLAKRSGLDRADTNTLIAAAILHDAAIPPYGHLVESEFKNSAVGFKHEKRVEDLIRGTINSENQYMQPVPNKSLQVASILDKYNVSHQKVIDVICPDVGRKSPISAQVDLDNIDNVHRMAAMLGWSDSYKNVEAVLSGIRLRGLGEMIFSAESAFALQKWMDFRQRIYTLIIAHPECIPYNALQTDLVRLAIASEIVTPDHWWLSEPVFEEKLRASPSAGALASQLISGCEYQTVDYVWLKNFQSAKKLHNGQIVDFMEGSIDTPSNHGYFVWNEKGLISRKIEVALDDRKTRSIGEDSTSCMVALVKKTAGKGKWSKASSMRWRREVIEGFAKLFAVSEFELDFPETYTGEFLKNKNDEIRFS
ncbi:HD domain-containing protein [Acidovorax sp. NCPPB 4044]|uniref:HD domain-containing protein n=1 Tax=Acidovorax sp. NCPPB 4044 TaxID=2940490 RepID=UPI0023039608|nr:HD domain-containing protein [Acidovorax sp. NCPPB 4044]MDA8520200.1 HD domain-containing protein [Acidovorax sp. NCPPB 4044]